MLFTEANRDHRTVLQPSLIVPLSLQAMGSLGFDHAEFEEPVKERAAQKSYWADHSATASVEAMMLDSQAAVIDKEERPEVCVWVVS